MVVLQCLSSSQKDADCRRGLREPVKVAALAFNSNGSHAAYAVHRSCALPLDGNEDPSHCVFVATTYAPGTEDPAEPQKASDLLPFADWDIVQILRCVHTAPVTALSWCRNTSALVSASADRCICVWTTQEASSAAQRKGEAAPSLTKKFLNSVPQLVMLSSEVLLSPTAVAWSVCGNKLYLGSAGGTVAVGRYDVSQRWWICRILLAEKTHAHHRFQNNSTNTATLATSSSQQNGNNTIAAVTTREEHAHRHISEKTKSFFPPPSTPRDRLVAAIVPHPSDNAKIAVAFLNGTVQVLSTHIKSVDGSTEQKLAGEEKDKKIPCEPFGHVYFTCSIPCWLHCLAWNLSGTQLAVVGHDSTLHVWQCSSHTPSSVHVAAEENSATHSVLRLRTLPLVQCAFASDDTVVAAGFDGRVYAFAASARQGKRTWRLAAEAEESKNAITTTPHVDPAKGPHSPLSVESQKRATDPNHTNAVPSKAGTLEADASAKIMLQRAVELFEKGSSQSTAAEQVLERTSRAPIRLLVSLPLPCSSSASSAAETDASQQPGAFVSSNGDGLVQVWCLKNDTSVCIKEVSDRL